MSEHDNTVQSPCIRNCCLNEEDVCLGCFRTIDEIMHWTEADNEARLVILQSAKLRREAHNLNKGNFGNSR